MAQQNWWDAVNAISGKPKEEKAPMGPQPRPQPAPTAETRPIYGPETRPVENGQTNPGNPYNSWNALPLSDPFRQVPQEFQTPQQLPADVDNSRNLLSLGLSGVGGSQLLDVASSIDSRRMAALQVSEPVSTSAPISSSVTGQFPTLTIDEKKALAPSTYTYADMLLDNLGAQAESIKGLPGEVASDIVDTVVNWGNFKNPLGETFVQKSNEVADARSNNYELAKRAEELRSAYWATSMQRPGGDKMATPETIPIAPFYKQAEEELGKTFTTANPAAPALSAIGDAYGNLKNVPIIGTEVSVAQGLITGAIEVAMLPGKATVAVPVSVGNGDYVSLGEAATATLDVLQSPANLFNGTHGSNPLTAFGVEWGKQIDGVLRATYAFAPRVGSVIINEEASRRAREQRAQTTQILGLSGAQSQADNRKTLENIPEEMARLQKIYDNATLVAGTAGLPQEIINKNAAVAAETHIQMEALKDTRALAYGHVNFWQDAFLSTVLDPLLWWDSILAATGKTALRHTPAASRWNSATDMLNANEKVIAKAAAEVAGVPIGNRSAFAKIVEPGMSKVLVEGRDAKAVFAYILQQVSVPGDVEVIFDKLVENPEIFFRDGIDKSLLLSPGLKVGSEATVKFPVNILGMASAPEVIATLRRMRGQFDNLVSLVGDFHKDQLVEELTTSFDREAASKWGVLKSQINPPIGSAKVEVVVVRDAKTGKDLNYISFVGADGKEVGKELVATKVLAESMAKEATSLLKGGQFLKFNPLQAATQRLRSLFSIGAINFNPGQWIGNAVSGNITGLTTGSSSFRGPEHWFGILDNIFPEGAPYDFAVRGAVEKYTDQSQGFMKKLRGVRGGQTFFGIGNIGFNFGENALKLAAYTKGLTEFLGGTSFSHFEDVIFPALKTAGAPPELAKLFKDSIQYYGRTGDLGAVERAVNGFLTGKVPEFNAAKYGTIYSDLISTAAKKKIDAIILDVSIPSEQRMRRVSEVLASEKARYGDIVPATTTPFETATATVSHDLADNARRVQVSLENLKKNGVVPPFIPTNTQKISSELMSAFNLAVGTRRDEWAQELFNFWESVRTRTRNVNAEIDQFGAHIHSGGGADKTALDLRTVELYAELNRRTEDELRGLIDAISDPARLPPNVVRSAEILPEEVALLDPKKYRDVKIFGSEFEKARDYFQKLESYHWQEFFKKAAQVGGGESTINTFLKIRQEIENIGNKVAAELLKPQAAVDRLAAQKASGNWSAALEKERIAANNELYPLKAKLHYDAGVKKAKLIKAGEYYLDFVNDFGDGVLASYPHTGYGGDMKVLWIDGDLAKVQLPNGNVEWSDAVPRDIFETASKRQAYLEKMRVDIESGDYWKRLNQKAVSIQPAASATPTQYKRVTFAERNAGWKFHLSIKDEAARREVEKFLSANKDKWQIEFKVGRNSGQSGKDVTIYIGDRVAAEKIAKEIEGKIASFLNPTTGDALKDDIPFSPHVAGRFDATNKRLGDSTMVQYGFQGHGVLDTDYWEKSTNPAYRATAKRRAEEFIRKHPELKDIYDLPAAATSSPTVASSSMAPRGVKPPVFNPVEGHEVLATSLVKDASSEATMRAAQIPHPTGVAEDSMRLIDQLEREIRSDPNFATPYGRLPPEHVSAAVKALNDFKNQSRSWVAAASEYGKAVSDFQMIDTTRFFVPDLIAGLMFPYHTFTTRTFKNLFERVMTIPAVRHAFRIESDYFERMNGDSNKRYFTVNIGGVDRKIYASLSKYMMNLGDYAQSGAADVDFSNKVLGTTMAISQNINTQPYPWFSAAYDALQGKTPYFKGMLPQAPVVYAGAAMLLGSKIWPGVIEDRDAQNIGLTLSGMAQSGQITAIDAMYAQGLLKARREGQPPPAFLNSRLAEIDNILDTAIRKTAKNEMTAGLSRLFGGTTVVNVNPDVEAVRAAQRQYGDYGYPNNPAGGKNAQKEVIATNAGLPVVWQNYNSTLPDKENPAIAGRRQEYYDKQSDVFDRQAAAVVAALIANPSLTKDEMQAIKQPFYDEGAKLYDKDKGTGEYADVFPAPGSDRTSPYLRNPSEEAIFQLESLLRGPGDKPPYPQKGGAETPEQKAEMYTAIDKWEAARLDAVERTIEQLRAEEGDPGSSWKSKMLKIVDGQYASELIRKYIELKYAPPEEKKWDDIISLAEEKTSYEWKQRGEYVKARLGEGVAKLWSVYSQVPKEAKADYVNANPQLILARIAAFNPSGYDSAVRFFGQKHLDQYAQYKAGKPTYPGENATDAQLESYRAKMDTLSAKYPDAHAVDFWLNGRYHWYFALEGQRENVGGFGKDYEEALRLFGQDIFRAEAAIPFDDGKKAIAIYYESHGGGDRFRAFRAWKNEFQDQKPGENAPPLAMEQAFPSPTDLNARPYGSGRGPIGNGTGAPYVPPVRPSPPATVAPTTPSATTTYEASKKKGAVTGPGPEGLSDATKWGKDWDAYRLLGDDTNAKRKYLAEHPEFAAYMEGYYKTKGYDVWWKGNPKGGAPRGGGGGGGRGGSGGGGSGSAAFPSLWSQAFNNVPRVTPKGMDPNLWQSVLVRLRRAK